MTIHAGGPAANWAWSISHLIPGYDTMEPRELEQLVVDLTSPGNRAARAGTRRRR